MLTEKDYCDYDTCVALKELGYNQPSIAFYPCQDIIVDCIDSNGELYEAEYDKGNLVLYSSLNNKNHDINKVQAPLLYEAQKWLREEKEIYVTVIPEYNDYRPVRGVKYRLEIAHWKDDEFGYETIEWLDEECSHTIITFDSYEEALSEGIKEAVKILKEKYE